MRFPKALLIVLTGPNGSGKGHNGKVLEVDYGAKHITFSDCLDEARRDDSTMALEIKKQKEEAGLVSGEICNKVFDRYVGPRILKAYEEKTLVVLEGLPRTIEQVNHFSSFLSEHEIEEFIHIFLDGPFDILTERLLERQRFDDTPEKIRKRFEDYRTLIVPAIETLARHPGAINHRIDLSSKPSKENVAKKVRKFLGLKRRRKIRVGETVKVSQPLPEKTALLV